MDITKAIVYIVLLELMFFQIIYFVPLVDSFNPIGTFFLAYKNNHHNNHFSLATWSAINKHIETVDCEKSRISIASREYVQAWIFDFQKSYLSRRFEGIEDSSNLINNKQMAWTTLTKIPLI